MIKKINILFFGTPDYSVPTLDTLYKKDNVNVLGVITKEDKEAGRGKKISISPIKKYCIENNIPYFQPSNLRKNLDEFFKFCNGLGEIDLNVVIAFGQILPKEVLNLPKHGSINLHASILPHLRGAGPIKRAIMDGDNITGVSLMKMDEGLDTGDVFLTQETTIDDTTTFQMLHDTLSSMSASIINENIEKIILNELSSFKQNERTATYAKKILKEEAYIDWNKPTKEILRLINAMDPSFGAYSIYNEKRLKFFSPEIFNNNFEKYFSTPAGSIVDVQKEYLLVKTKDGLLKIKELQLEGKKRLTVKDFLSGNKMEVGEKLS